MAASITAAPPPAPDSGADPENEVTETALISLARTQVELRPTGALFWPERSLLCISDMHLGRAERAARDVGDALPTYQSIDTLDRLESEINALKPRRVVCLGDSFDDLVAAHDLATVRDLTADVLTRLGRLAAGRQWTWVAGIHDPGPVALPGSHLAELRLGLLNFRHVALPRLAPGGGEVSGHFHPKARLTRYGAQITRRCFVTGGARAIMPAFGGDSSGLDAGDPAFDALLGLESRAYLLGDRVTSVSRDGLG